MQEVHIVTGASSGVGLALCQHLARQDYTVLGIARRKPELEAMRAACPERIHILAADLGSQQGRQRVCEAIEGKFQVRSLVHSAAIATQGYLKDLDYTTYRELMAINLEAPLFLTSALLPSMCPGARVLHLSSGSAHRAAICNGLYSISKAALLMCYQSWNADFPDGEFVFGSAMPGVVEGPMQDAARSGDNPSTAMFVGYKEQGLLIQPSRVAQFLAWLLFSTSDEDYAAQDWNIFDETHHKHWLHGRLPG